MTVTISATTILLALNVVGCAAIGYFFRHQLRRPRHLWLAGEYKGMTKRGHVIWDLRGIYSTREKALSACSAKNHFLTRLELDQLLPEKNEDQPVTEYPRLKVKEAN